MRETQITISDYFKSRMFATIQVTLCEINTFTLLLFVWVFRMPLANSTAFCLESSVPADSSQLKPLSLIFIMWEWRDSNPLNRKATDLLRIADSNCGLQVFNLLRFSRPTSLTTRPIRSLIYSLLCIQSVPTHHRRRTPIILCGGVDLNHRQPDFQSGTLPTELPPH